MRNPAVAAVEPVGDVAVSVPIAGSTTAETLRRVRAAADAVRAAVLPGVTDVVASPGRVTVACEAALMDDLAAVEGWIAAVVAAAGEAAGGEPVRHEIPVAYDGPDLEEVCAGHGITRAGFIADHTAAEYVVEAIGFLPGFGYLAGLPPSLATPRRATPRRLVPAGSVGIGGAQTGVYPFASPGGWNLVGRASVRLFDAERSRPALVEVGDRVRFLATDLPPAGATPERPAAPATPAGVTIIQPGLFTTVQDLGRPGHRAAGVPLSGAADSLSLRLANLLVGNAEGAAAIECTLLGPTLRFERDAVVALAGADFPGFAGGVATRVPAGTVITLGHATAGCRGYLAVAGGIDVEPVLGSRSTLVVAGLGGFAGRPLRVGDGLPVGRPRAVAGGFRGLETRGHIAGVAGERPRGLEIGGHVEAAVREMLRGLETRGRGEVVLRVIPGGQADAFGAAAWARTFRTSSRSDRMGVRLEGDPLPGDGAFAGMASVAVFPGTVQVPPDGRPIVLLADAQTIGGYPVLGQVIAADLPRVAQLRPGDELRFEPVSLAEAQAARQHVSAAIAAVLEAVR